LLAAAADAAAVSVLDALTFAVRVASDVALAVATLVPATFAVRTAVLVAAAVTVDAAADAYVTAAVAEALAVTALAEATLAVRTESDAPVAVIALVAAAVNPNVIRRYVSICASSVLLRTLFQTITAAIRPAKPSGETVFEFEPSATPLASVALLEPVVWKAEGPTTEVLSWKTVARALV
jgi:hypothetical protein